MADLKKLLITVPVLLVSCFCGCNKSDDKEDIVFTAAEPLHQLGANTSVEQIACISNYACDDDYDAYEDFIDYYYNDFKPSYDCSFYILNPGDGLKGFIPH
ncbi:MAG: hypothetical protein LUD19_04535, partial [Clostridia bacterium]|nr:hypothetical protein [Clostridia bacterium]